jgi:hypothetical protein
MPLTNKNGEDRHSPSPAMGELLLILTSSRCERTNAVQFNRDLLPVFWTEDCWKIPV